MSTPAVRSKRAFALTLTLLSIVLSSLVSSRAAGQNLNFPAATESPNVSMGSAPSFATFNGKLYAAYRSNDSRNVLYISTSTDGVDFNTGTGYTNITMGSAPSLAVFNGKLCLAFQANDPSHDLYVTSSSDGVNFATPTGYSGITIGSAPSLAVLNNTLYLAFQANDSGHAIWTGQSTDGVNFSVSEDSSDQTAGAPSLTEFNGSLYLGFISNDTRNVLYVASSTTGSFGPATAYTNITMGTTPSLASANGVLYISFQANDSGHDLYVTGSNTGTNFPSATGFGGIQIGGPAAAAQFGDELCIGFKSNDSRNLLFTTSNGPLGGGYNYSTYSKEIGVDLNNNTRGAYSNSQIYVEVLGINPSTGVFNWVQSNGTMAPINPNDANASNHLTHNGVNYPNYSFNLGQSTELILPQLSSGRIYISVGSPMYIAVTGSGSSVGYAGPNPQNSSDPNNNTHYDWYEFTYNSSGLYINTTQVNQFGLPLLLDVFGANHTFHQQTGIVQSQAQIDQAYQSETPSAFSASAVSSYRILSPAETTFGSGQSNGTYFDSYISQTWSYYASNALTVAIGSRTFSGKTSGNTFTFNEVNTGNGAFQGGTGYVIGYPTTQQVLVCNGAFATGDPNNSDRNSVELQIEAQLCAAFNRHVATTSNEWTIPSDYYGAAPANYYAAFWHRHSINGLSYGFPYDDVNSQSSTITTGQPEHMAFGIGW